MIAVLLSVILGAGCMLLTTAAHGSTWLLWLGTTGTSTLVLGWLWPKRWIELAPLLLITQPVALYVLTAASGEIAHPANSTGGAVAVGIASCFMFMWAPVPLFTAWLGAWIGRGEQEGRCG